MTTTIVEILERVERHYIQTQRAVQRTGDIGAVISLDTLGHSLMVLKQRLQSTTESEVY